MAEGDKEVTHVPREEVGEQLDKDATGVLVVAASWRGDDEMTRDCAAQIVHDGQRRPFEAVVYWMDAEVGLLETLKSGGGEDYGVHGINSSGQSEP